MQSLNILIHCLNHVIGGFALSVFLLKDHIAFQVQRAKKWFINILIGDHQITLSDLKFLCKFFYLIKMIDLRFDH